MTFYFVHFRYFNKIAFLLLLSQAYGELQREKSPKTAIERFPKFLGDLENKIDVLFLAEKVANTTFNLYLRSH